MKAFIFDIDGTLADASHRLHHIQNGNKDWDAFFARAPARARNAILQVLSRCHNYNCYPL